VARPLRIEFEDALYHICARGNARERIFHSDAERVRFLQLLEQSAKRFNGVVFCFVLMGNHFHLLVQTHRPNLSRWMQWLIVSYSVFFNRRHRRSGHLFQGRYKSFLVEGGEYLLGLSRYIHLNPVRGLSLGRGTPAERRERLRRFKWSSYGGYAGLARPFGFVEEEMVLGELGGSRRGERLRYRRFTEEGLLREIKNPFEAVRWQAVLGSDGFLQQIRDRLKGLEKKGREISSLRKLQRSVGPEEILRRVARKFGLDPKRLRQRGDRGLRARNIAMWVIWESCGITLREIGDFFGGLDYAAVAQRIRRARSNYADKAAQRLLTEISNI
jgi:REP element-mobilizing transposase RayT